MRTTALHDTTNAMHLRRRAQRAEDEARSLRIELAQLQDAIAEERAALIAYVNSLAHAYDITQLLQATGRDTVREMAERHQSCTTCGGYRREMWDAMLAPTLEAMREAMGLPAPDGEAAPSWPVAPGARYHRGDILRPFLTRDEEAAQAARQRAFAAQMAREDRAGLSGW